jgi:hypothetical protein
LPESRQHEAMQPGDGAAPHAPRLLHPFHDRPQKTDSKIQTTDSSDSMRPLLGIWLTEIYCRHERLVVCENVPIELNVEVGRLEEGYQKVPILFNLPRRASHRNNDPSRRRW